MGEGSPDQVEHDGTHPLTAASLAHNAAAHDAAAAAAHKQDTADNNNGSSAGSAPAAHQPFSPPDAGAGDGSAANAVPAPEAAVPHAAAAASGAAARPSAFAATAVDIPGATRSLTAHSKSVTTGLHSGGSPATDTTIQASPFSGGDLAVIGAAGGRRAAALLTALALDASNGHRAAVMTPTPATSLSTGVGSNPSVTTDVTLPPAPSGELVAVFAGGADRRAGSSTFSDASGAPASEASGPAAGRSPRDASVVAFSTGGGFMGATLGTSVSNGLPDNASDAIDDTLANVPAAGHSSTASQSPTARQLRQFRRNLSGRRSSSSELSRKSPDGALSSPGFAPADGGDLLASGGGGGSGPAAGAAGVPRGGSITTIPEQPSGSSAGAGGDGSSASLGGSIAGGGVDSGAAADPEPEGAVQDLPRAGHTGQVSAEAVAEAEAPPDGSSRSSELADDSGDSSSGSVTSPFNTLQGFSSAAAETKQERQQPSGPRQHHLQPMTAPQPRSSSEAASAAVPPDAKESCSSASPSPRQQNPSPSDSGSRPGSPGSPASAFRDTSASGLHPLDQDEYPDLDEEPWEEEDADGAVPLGSVARASMGGTSAVSKVFLLGSFRMLGIAWCLMKAREARQSGCQQAPHTASAALHMCSHAALSACLCCVRHCACACKPAKRRRNKGQCVAHANARKLHCPENTLNLHAVGRRLRRQRRCDLAGQQRQRRPRRADTQHRLGDRKSVHQQRTAKPGLPGRAAPAAAGGGRSAAAGWAARGIG